jgi:hypothetical protein
MIQLLHYWGIIPAVDYTHLRALRQYGTRTQQMWDEVGAIEGGLQSFVV